MHTTRFHLFALFLIGLSFIAKLISILLSSDLHHSLKFFEFFSVACYFLYVGWLGFSGREYREKNEKYILYSTILVVLDISIYYFFKGWV